MVHKFLYRLSEEQKSYGQFSTAQVHPLENWFEVVQIFCSLKEIEITVTEL